MRKEEYIQQVVSYIGNLTAKKDVEIEISAHIDDRISYYMDAGWDEEAATEKAMEHMGEPEDIAIKMGRLHQNKLSKGLLILTGVGVFKFLLAMFFYFTFYSGTVLNYMASSFAVIEVVTDASTLFIAQPAIVIIIAILINHERLEDKEYSKSDTVLTVVCIVVWIFAAIVSSLTTLRGF